MESGPQEKLVPLSLFWVHGIWSEVKKITDKKSVQIFDSWQVSDEKPVEIFEWSIISDENPVQNFQYSEVFDKKNRLNSLSE